MRNSLAFRVQTHFQITAIYWKESLCTNSIELNVFVAQVLSSQVNIILRFAIGDQHSNLSGVRSHPNILLEIILEDVVQSHACNESVMNELAEVENALCWLRYVNTCHCVSSFVGKVSHGIQQRVPCWMSI